MRMLDLFCGRFGWGRAFAERGWDVVGVDLVEPADIPEGCTFVKANILTLRSVLEFNAEVDCAFCLGTGNFYGNDEDGDYLRCDDCVDGRIGKHFGPFDFICASSPCEQFSVHGMKHFHPNPKYPEMGIKLFNHTRSLCEASGLPYVMENVRAAQQFVGKAVNHCGPFYLWGSAVPPLMPQGIKKAIEMGSSKIINQLAGEARTSYRREHTHLGRIGWHGSKQRDAATARFATIPPELAACVADYAMRTLEVTA